MRFTRWDQLLTTAETNDVCFRLAQWHLLRIENPQVRASLSDLLDRRDVRGLCHYEPVPSGHIGDYRHSRQIVALFGKRRDLDIGVDTEAVAWEKFVESEELCRETNYLFRLVESGGFSFPPDVEGVIFHAIRKISSILGDAPSLEQLKMRFGPGATTTVAKQKASARRKLSSEFACSEDAIGRISDVLAEVPLWIDQSVTTEHTTVSVSIHDGKIAFVPKNAKTARTICVEPMLNGFVQLGIGDYMSSRLRRSGVDLRDQTRNQRLALKGSVSGALATLDLSSASDTIASKLVESMLPYDWWDLLRSFRTGRVKTPAGIMRLEKFSSMGNGFTFPLESLIFYALAYACTDGDKSDVSVYGDDIIVPTEAVPLLIRTLHVLGFKVNSSKSFISGPFRESCGKDYWLGTDVRPFYLKDVLSGHQLFSWYNFYTRVGYSEAALILLDFIDESIRIFGPDGYGDGHLIGDWSPIPMGRDKGYGGFVFETFTYKSNRAYYKLGADYVFPSYSIYLKGASSEDPLKDAASKPRLWQRSHGPIRPSGDSVRYVRHNGRVFLEDTLPGIRGYKRIKVYTLNGV